MTTSYITPFPENDTYRLEVWGDVLAEGLLAGLVDQLADEPRISVQRKHRPMQSLMRANFDEIDANGDSQISREEFTERMRRLREDRPEGRRRPEQQ